jgi:hypothetical protein
MKANYKVPICTECGTKLKGKVPLETTVVCYFCSNPPFDDNGEENTSLKHKDTR